MGTYTLTVTPPAGDYADTPLVGSQGGTPAADSIGNITVGIGTTGKNNDFGLLAAASLSGYVFSELTAGSPALRSRQSDGW